MIEQAKANGLRSHRLGIIDPDQDGAGCDVLPAHDGNFSNPAVDTCGEIDPRCVDLALNEKRLAKLKQAMAAKVVADAQLANINAGTRAEVIAARKAAYERAEAATRF